MSVEAMPDDELTQPSLGWDVAACQQSTGGLTLTTYTRKNRRYDVVSSEEKFVDIAYNNFDLSQTCRILLHENPSFRGHKDALAAALCGWMLDPKERIFRRRLVALSIGTTLAKAEQAANKRSSRQTYKAHRYPLSTRWIPTFFAELYNAIGGLRTIVRTPAHYGIYYELSTNRDRLYDTMRVAAIDHCHHDAVRKNVKLDNISIERSCEIYVLVEMAISGCLAPDVANLKSHYLSKFEESIPFLYAASTIMLTEKQSLLRAIAAAKWQVILRPGILRELFGRTLFYAQNVFVKNQDAKNRVRIAHEISNVLCGVEPRRFDPPVCVSACTKIIEHGYTRAGYDACHDEEGKLSWKKMAFWSALDLPVPEYKRRSRNGII